MKDSQKPDHVSLANMVSRLREGRVMESTTIQPSLLNPEVSHAHPILVC